MGLSKRSYNPVINGPHMPTHGVDPYLPKAQDQKPKKPHGVIQFFTLPANLAGVLVVAFFLNGHNTPFMYLGPFESFSLAVGCRTIVHILAKMWNVKKWGLYWANNGNLSPYIPPYAQDADSEPSAE